MMNKKRTKDKDLRDPTFNRIDRGQNTCKSNRIKKQRVARVSMRHAVSQERKEFRELEQSLGGGLGISILTWQLGDH